jgi:hypothetical protein
MVADDPESFADLDGHQDPEEEKPEEETESKEVSEAMDRAAREREVRLAKQLLDSHAEWVRTQTSGYDDPLTGVCYAPIPTTIGPRDRTANDPLRRDANGNPVPDSEAKGAPHTQLGTRTSESQGGNPKYRQGMEYDKDGKPVRRVDHTNHGRSNHTNPHQHRFDPKTGKIGDNEPLSPPDKQQTPDPLGNGPTNANRVVPKPQ